VYELVVDSAGRGDEILNVFFLLLFLSKRHRQD
jgi:hypothetical protein